MNVTKRDGSREPLDLNKLHQVVYWATEGITGVSASEVEIKSHLQFYDGIKTTDIQETLIKAASELITEETPNYQYVAGRLINYHLRKQVYGQFEPWPLHKIVKRNVELGYYDPELLDSYTEDEFDKLNFYINHDRDNNFTYTAMEQLRGKYLIQNRVSGEIFETPQICYMLVAAALFATYPKESRMKWVKDYYNAISNFELSLPTPIMAGVRTTEKQFSSCVLIESGDSLESINQTSAAVVKYVSKKAGIGINAGRIRAKDSSVRNGAVSHTGVVPFYKLFQAAVKSCSQGGIRGGSATIYYPVWHLEVEDLLVLKNNKGVEDNRVRHMDYGVQFSGLFYERLLKNENITLFSPHEVPGMYDAFFSDQEKFKKIYEAAEKNKNLRKRVVPAVDLFSAFANERVNTGRIYLMNVDHANEHSAYKPELAPVKQSNLCAEITLSTTEMGKTRTVYVTEEELPEYIRREDVIEIKVSDDNKYAAQIDESRIALCSLSAINWGAVKNKEDFERVCRLAVRGLDALLDYQHYPVLAAKLHTMEYRPLGIGIINLAYWMAKNDMNYTNPNLELLHEWVEAWSYYLISASVELAKEKGACELVNHSKYSDGILPIDTYKQAVDELAAPVYHMDWDALRTDLRETGIRNTTLMALMPSESSSQISNATNGVEPPRAFVSVKESKHGVLKQVVPEYRRLKSKYELLWDQKSPEGYLKIMAVINKFIDQSISTNTSYNPEMYPEEKIPMSELLGHLLLAYRWGIKTLYYNNINDNQGELDFAEEPAQEESVVVVSDDADCDSCSI